jgi:hypothetical protein
MSKWVWWGGEVQYLWAEISGAYNTDFGLGWGVGGVEGGGKQLAGK